MRILHVITSLRTGGAEKLMMDLLPRMNEYGVEVDLCVFDGVRTAFYEELEKKGVKIYALSKSVYSLVNLWKLIWLIRKYDVVHSHNTACQYYVAIASLFVTCRVFTTEHNTTNKRRSKWWWYVLDKWMYNRYDKIICISEETRNALIAYLHKELVDNKYKTIYNGIDVASYTLENLIEPSTSDGYVRILMVSAFRWEKDQKTLIRALALLEEKYKVCFVGGGEDALMQECVMLSKEKGVENRIEFLGVRNDVRALLAQATIVVQSSHVDGFCLSAVEGMASGKPVIASDIPGLGDVVRGYGVLFPHEDYKALADEIRKLCEDEEYAEEVAVRCQERAKMFDISVMVEKYMEVYHSLG